MRKIILLVGLITIFACKQKSSLEIIPDYENIYLGEKELDVKPEIKTEGKEKEEEFTKLLTEKFHNSQNDVYFQYELTLYINEAGQPEKMKIIPLASGEFVNPHFEILKKSLGEFFEDQEFSPGMKNGKPVKSQWKFIGEYAIKKDGKLDILYGFNPDLSGLLSNVRINEDEYYKAVDKMPAPVGGLMAIVEKVTYPEKAKNDGIEGRVFIKAFIDTSGNVVSAQVVKGLRFDCDKAAIEAIKQVKFTPGEIQNRKVKTSVMIPILFKLK